MAARSVIRGVYVGRRGVNVPLVLRLVMLCVFVATWMGCRSATPNDETSLVQAGEEAVETDAAQPTEPNEPDSDGRVARITVEKPVLDLNDVGTDSKVSGEFTFVSSGEGVLRIVKTHSCCGVSIRGVKDGQAYRPGERGTVEFDWLTDSGPKPSVQKVIRLQTNDPDQKFVSLTIRAKVVRRVEIMPKRLRLFLRRENAACDDITLRSLDGKPFAITSFRSVGDSISADFDPNTEATEFVIKPKVDMEKLENNIRGMVSIRLTHPECNSVRLGYDVLPEFTISPAMMTELNLRPGQPIQRDVAVIGNYGDEFDIESVSSPKGYIKLVEKKKVEDHYQLRIEIVPPAQDAQQAAAASVPEGQDATAVPENASILLTDTLEVKIKDGRTLSVPFRGFYVLQSPTN